MTENWQDKIVGARMTVDGQYASTIDNSPFSRQEWGLIMTAVDFDIQEPADDERARLVADTSNLEAIMPEVEKAGDVAQLGPGAAQRQESGGLLSSLKERLGLGGEEEETVDPERVSAAEKLVEGYASQLQAHLEEEGRWDDVRRAYRA